MECSLQNWPVSGYYYLVAGDLNFPRDTYSVQVEGGMLESGAKVPMQCRSRNRVTERRKRNGVGRVGGERHSVWRERGGRVFYGKIDVIVRWALKRVCDETSRWICIMVIHKSKILNDWSYTAINDCDANLPSLMWRKLYRGYLCHVLPREPIISASTWVLGYFV